MGQLIWPINEKIAGPWLLSRERLENLDLLFDKISKDLVQSFNNEVEYRETENRKQNFIDGTLRDETFNKTAKSATIVSSEKAILPGESITELLKSPDLKNIKPKELSLKFQKGTNNVFQFEITKSGELSYHLYAFDEKIRYHLKDEIEIWVENNKPGKILQFWTASSPFFTVLSFLFCLIAFFSRYEESTHSFKSLLVKQADSLISKGITKENEIKAIELILKIESGLSPKPAYTEEVFNPTADNIFRYSLAIFILFCFTPQTVIGIGKSRFMIKVYNFWIKLLFVIIPSTFLYPEIIGYFKRFFHLS